MGCAMPRAGSGAPAGSITTLKTTFGNPSRRREQFAGLAGCRAQPPPACHHLPPRAARPPPPSLVVAVEADLCGFLRVVHILEVRAVQLALLLLDCRGANGRAAAGRRRQARRQRNTQAWQCGGHLRPSRSALRAAVCCRAQPAPERPGSRRSLTRSAKLQEFLWYRLLGLPQHIDELARPRLVVVAHKESVGLACRGMEGHSMGRRVGVWDEGWQGSRGWAGGGCSAAGPQKRSTGCRHAAGGRPVQAAARGAASRVRPGCRCASGGRTRLAGAPRAPDAVHVVLCCEWEGVVEYCLWVGHAGQERQAAG